MRRSMLVFAMLFGFILTTAPLAVAQDEEVDVAEISETVLAADPEALVEGLESPPEDDQLPEGFVNPPSGTPANQEISEAFTSEVSDFDDTLGTVNFIFDTDPEVVPGEVSTGILTYIVLEEEVTEEVFDEYRSGLEESIATPVAGADTSIEDVEVGGVESVLVTFNQSDGSTSAVVQLLSVPVGNTIVIGTVVAGSQEEIDPAEIQTNAEELTLAGIEYLATLAEE